MFTRRAFVRSAIPAAGCVLSARLSRAENAENLLTVFRYSDVQLLPGPAKKQFDQNHSFFLNLSEDRLLKIYRQRTGLPAPGEDMGGWYDGFCPGASFGQYVSALARFAAATDSERTRAKVNRLVTGYAQTVDPSGKFFVDLRYPGYTYDKLVCGLLDAHTWANTPNAIAVLHATTRAAQPHMPERALTAEEQRTRPHKDETYTWDETYTMAENLFLAYERTGDRQFFEMGKRYLLDRTFFDPLSQGQNVLPGLHAYSHVNALSSGMQGYLKLGDRKYLRAVTNAIDWIWQDQSFATGGWGPNEGFVEPGKGQLGASISTTHRSFETPCGAYAHFKVMRYLLCLTADARYGESLEQLFYNTVLGAKPIREDGWSFYYSDYGHAGHKTDHRSVRDSPWPWDHDGRWPCCSGTLPQVAADYGISSYFRARDGVYVNLYVPSRLNWALDRSTSCTLTQRTDYPRENLVALHVDPSSAREFSIYVRIPAWAGPNTSISVNGKRLTASIQPASFFKIGRTWKRGDLVELELDQPVTTRPIDAQTPDQVAVVRGPLVLFAIEDQQPTLDRAKLGQLQINKDANDHWTLETPGGKHPVRSFYEIGDETYQTYWRAV
jgi:uncharacterized protein